MRTWMWGIKGGPHPERGTIGQPGEGRPNSLICLGWLFDQVSARPLACEKQLEIEDWVRMSR